MSLASAVVDSLIDGFSVILLVIQCRRSWEISGGIQDIWEQVCGGTDGENGHWLFVQGNTTTYWRRTGLYLQGQHADGLMKLANVS